MKKKSTGAILIVGSAKDCPDLEYACGFRAIDAAVLLKKGQEHFLVVPQLELGRAQRTSGVINRRGRGTRVSGGVEVLTPEMLGLRGGKRRRVGEWVVRLLKAANVRQVLVSARFPHGIARRLERAGVRIRIADGELFPERAVKTADEINKIKRCQQATVIAMRAAISTIGSASIGVSGDLLIKGRRLTSEDIRRLIIKVLLDHDCFCGEIIVACGDQSTDPHEIGSGPLRAHESIVIDIFPQHLASGYWGDLTRTVVRGRVPGELKKMYRAVKSAQAAALNRIKPGVKCSTVHRAASDEFVRRGYRTEIVDGKAVGYIHSTGHGVGLAVHEGPALGVIEDRLKSGHVVTVEPGLYYPGTGGIRIEDTVVVTGSGWRYLVPCEKRLEV